jgi:hypothetical protein
MKKRFETIGAFVHDYEAQILRSRLEAMGIDSIVLGSHDPQSLILQTPSYRVQVESQDFERAKHALYLGDMNNEISDPTPPVQSPLRRMAPILLPILLMLAIFFSIR